jgi:predicted NUDIX family phosphoesterase
VAQDGPPESILCFTASDLDDPSKHAPGRFCGFRSDAMETATRLYPHGVFRHHFRLRTSVLECDDKTKQVVACVVPWHAATRQVWTFQRGHTEGRLEGKRSCLPGGHVASIDAWPAGPDDTHPDLLDVCYRAALRELGEEIENWQENWSCRHTDVRLTLIGVVNDESTLVDQCHFGLIYRLDVPTLNFEDSTPAESPAAGRRRPVWFSGLVGKDGRWQPVESLLGFAESLESWTHHVVRYLAETTPVRSSF